MDTTTREKDAATTGNGQRGVAIVTGARRGIGRAICVELAKSGFDIAVVDIDADDSGEETVRQVTAKGRKAAFFKLDISSTADYSTFLSAVEEQLGSVTCLVNNAGVQVSERGDLLDVSEESFDRLIDINLRGTFFLTQSVARQMVAREVSGDRSIVFITSSNAGLVSPEKGPYCISKAGLSMASQQFALRLAEHDIHVFEIRPGLIRTDMTAEVFDRYNPGVEEGSLSPIRRWGEPEDVARAIASLVTGAIPFSTGDIYSIGGGLQIPRL